MHIYHIGKIFFQPYLFDVIYLFNPERKDDKYLSFRVSHREWCKFVVFYLVIPLYLACLWHDSNLF